MSKFEDFLPGMPEDPQLIPELRYQVLLGKVFTLKQWRDGSSARGEITLEDLQAIRGGAAVSKEGWYNEAGEYLGDDPAFPQYEEELPTLQ